MLQQMAYIGKMVSFLKKYFTLCPSVLWKDPKSLYGVRADWHSTTQLHVHWTLVTTGSAVNAQMWQSIRKIQFALKRHNQVWRRTQIHFKRPLFSPAALKSRRKIFPKQTRCD
jgi:hypothetical protein